MKRIYEGILSILALIGAVFTGFVIFLAISQPLPSGAVLVGQVLFGLAMIVFPLCTIMGYRKGNKALMYGSLVLSLFPLIQPLLLITNYLYFKDSSMATPKGSNTQHNHTPTNCISKHIEPIKS